MKTATLSAPVTVDPRQIASVRVVAATLIFSNNALQVSYETLDAQGAVVQRKTVNVATAQSQAYVGNQETTLLNALLSRLGLAGAIA